MVQVSIKYLLPPPELARVRRWLSLRKVGRAIQVFLSGLSEKRSSEKMTDTSPMVVHTCIQCLFDTENPEFVNSVQRKRREHYMPGEHVNPAFKPFVMAAKRYRHHNHTSTTCSGQEEFVIVD